MDTQNKERIKYRLFAKVVKLQLNKAISFQSRITWKRNINKSETKAVLHTDNQSIFNDSLDLQLNLTYDSDKRCFESKMTQFLVTVIFDGKIKSGGSAKFDSATILNENYTEQKVVINLNKCPDPDAYLQVIFSYEPVQQQSRSLFNELSMMSQADFSHQQDLSQIDFSEENQCQFQFSTNSSSQVNKESLKENQQLKLDIQSQGIKGKINLLNKRLGDIQAVCSSTKSNNCLNTTNYQSLMSSNSNQQQLKKKIVELENLLDQKEGQISKISQQNIQKGIKIISLERQIQEFHVEQRINSEQNQKLKSICQMLSQSQEKSKKLYKETIKQLEQAKRNTGDLNFSKQSMGFKKFMEEAVQVEQIADHFNEKSDSNSQKIQLLERQNIQLQTKIASISHQLAQIFNAAEQYGGDKLLDHLHSSIGLIQQSFT